MITPKRLIVSIAIAVLCSAAHAALPVIPPGEKIVFSDDFADNSNAWTNLAVVNGTGAPATAKAAIAKSTWTPSLPDRTSVSSVVTFKTPIALGTGTLSVYMCVRINDIEGVEGNRFWFTINEADTPSRFAGLVIRPANIGAILYRNASGAGESTPTENTRDKLNDSFAYHTLKLTITPSADGKGPASAEAFYYDTAKAKYTSLGSAKEAVFLKTGLFTTLSINCRNGDNGEVWFDAVAVTQAPPKR